MKAKKALGQHFLNREDLAWEIVDANQFAEGENVLEVGPGKGVLSKYLLEQQINFKMVELDQDMVSFLKRTYPIKEDQLIQEDILNISFSGIFDGRPFSIVGNFPYNISSQIMFKVFEEKKFVTQLVGMFQKEVAERIISPHGSKAYGILSVFIGLYFDSEMIMQIGPECFDPPPKVQSAVIRLAKKENVELSLDEKYFKRVVKMAFNQRRKMLRNSLKSLIIDKNLNEHRLFSKRPEQLSVTDFILLTDVIQNQ